MLDEPEAEQLLGLLPARLPELEALRLGDEAMGQRGFADPRLASEQHDPRMSGAHLRRLGDQAGELVLLADDGPVGPIGLGKM